MTKASLAVYGVWFALIVICVGYVGKFYPEAKRPAYNLSRRDFDHREVLEKIIA